MTQVPALAPVLLGWLFWVIPLLAAGAALASPRARAPALALVVLAAAIALTRDGVLAQAAAYDLLRRPGFAAIGAWIVAAALLLDRDLRLAALAGLLGRALVAVALVGQAALVTWAIAGYDPFAAEPQPLAPAHALLGLALLGAALGVGMASLCALGPARGAIDYAAALVAATSVLGPLYPGFDAFPRGLAGEIALAAAVAASAVAFIAAQDRSGGRGAAALAAAVLAAFASPALFALVLQEIAPWIIA